MPYTLEICAGSFDSALAALAGGAQRIELCAALSEGGLTPSAGLIERATSQLKPLVVNVLIRPRTGDFLYTEAEKEIIETDLRMAGKLGADGVVVGALTADGFFDSEFMKLCAHLAHDAGMSITCHRAFDMCRDPEQALEQLINWGYDRVLTSGQAASAREGTSLLARLVKQARERIHIMPGAGVNAGNAAEIVRLTGAREIHASARRPFASHMTYRHEGVSMGAPEADEFMRLETSEESVRAIINALREA